MGMRISAFIRNQCEYLRFISELIPLMTMAIRLGNHPHAAPYMCMGKVVVFRESGARTEHDRAIIYVQNQCNTVV